LSWDVEYMLPPEDVGQMPLNGAARVLIQGGTTVDVEVLAPGGSAVPVALEVEAAGAEHARAWVRPLESLEAGASYRWRFYLGGAMHERAIVAGPPEAPAAVEGAAFTSTLLGEGEDHPPDSCGEPQAFRDYRFEVEGVVGRYAVLATYASGSAFAYGPTVEARVWGDGERCISVSIEDAVGNSTVLGDTCIPAIEPDPDSSSSGDDPGAEGSSGTEDTTGSRDSSTSSETEPTRADDSLDRGCACATTTGSSAAWVWAVVLLATRRRRRDGRWKRPDGVQPIAADS
jgi:MYXO-CTERM domain-containing protein